MSAARFASRAALALLLCSALACGGARREVVEAPPPDPDTGEFMAGVAWRIATARQRVLDDPRSAEAWGELGMVFQAHLLMDDAGECYERARALDPGEFRWPYLAAVVGRGHISREQRLELLIRAHALNSVYPPLNIRIGELLLERDRPAEAGLHFQRALEGAPEDSHAWLGLGRVALAQGDLESARELLERARWMEWDHREVWIALVRVYELSGRMDLARRAAQRAEQLQVNTAIRDPLLQELDWFSGRPADLLHTASRHVRRGEFDRAVELYHVVLRSYPDDASVRLDLARTLALAWRDEQAVEELARALGSDASAAREDPRLADWRRERLPADRP